MSFQVKDKKKISVLRKCVQILTSCKEDFHMHFTKTHIRLFNLFQDETTYMIDFYAPWFSKFVAPDCILQSELETLQIKCNRDIFLQSFNIIDDTELEFLVSFESLETGKLKVIKTRDLYIVEANVPFEIEKEIRCDENYEFPENQLLIDGEVKHLKNLKGIFKAKAKAEILQLNFSDDTLLFKGEINNKFGYEIKTSSLHHYGTYLSNGIEVSNRYLISLSLRHILGLIKVCELTDGNFMSAMELLDPETCVCFMFTHSMHRDFKFCIGIGGVRFQRLDNTPNQRLKKQFQKPGMQNDLHQQMENMGIKQENQSETFGNQMLPMEESEKKITPVARHPQKVKTRQIGDEDQDDSDQLNVKEESEAEVKRQPKQDMRDANYNDNSQEDSEEEEEDQERDDEKRKQFYQEIEKEQFF